MHRQSSSFFLTLVAGTVFLAIMVMLLHQAPVVGDDQTACLPSGEMTGVPTSQTRAIFEGRELTAPAIANDTVGNSRAVLAASPEERWIEVDLSEQKLRAWDGNTLFLETLVSTGLPWSPTPTGEFHIAAKLRAQKMEGGQGKYYYNLPNVPFVMFFGNQDIPWWKGYSLHGTYWHNDFGKQHSHGCVNLPTSAAGQLYDWTTPTVPEGKFMATANQDNPGTRVVVHQ